MFHRKNKRTGLNQRRCPVSAVSSNLALGKDRICWYSLRLLSNKEIVPQKRLRTSSALRIQEKDSAEKVEAFYDHWTRLPVRASVPNNGCCLARIHFQSADFWSTASVDLRVELGSISGCGSGVVVLLWLFYTAWTWWAFWAPVPRSWVVSQLGHCVVLSQFWDLF